jgi:putative transposase
MRIKGIAQVRIRYGCQRIFTLLRREGWRDNHKRVHRLYCLEGLNLRTNQKKSSRAGSHRLLRPVLQSIDECWSMDFVCDNLFDGKRFRALTIVDNFSRKCHAIHVGNSIKGQEVVQVMERIRYNTAMLPQRIQFDNGTEFISKDFNRWAYENKVTLDYSRPANRRIIRSLNHLTAVFVMNVLT